MEKVQHLGIRIFGSVIWVMFLVAALYFLLGQPKSGTMANTITPMVALGSVAMLIGIPVLGAVFNKTRWFLVFMPFNKECGD